MKHNLASCYWVGGTADWDATAGTKWATTSGGAGGAAVPTSADNVFFDGNSGTGTTTITTTANCLALNFTGYTGTLAGSSDIDAYSTATFVSGMTYSHTGALNFKGSADFNFNPGGKTFGTVTINTSTNNTMNLTGALTCTTFTANSVKKTLQLGANLTVTGTFTCNGTGTNARYFVNSNSAGTSRTISAGTATIGNVLFRDITGAGAASWSGTDVQVGAGCSGITASAAVTRYWVGNGGSWEATAEWSSTSGGASGASVPGPNDTAVFDANSFSSGGLTCTVDTPILGSLTISGVTNSPTFTFSASTAYGNGFSYTPEMVGSFTRDTSTCTSSSAVVYMRNDGIGTANLSVGAWASIIYCGNAANSNISGVAVTLSANFTSTNEIRLNSGTLNTNGYTVSCTRIQGSNSNTRTLTLGASAITLTSTGNVLNFSTSTNMTLNANTSTISITDSSATGKTFAGGGKTWNAVSFDGTGTGILTISGSNTFASLTFNNNAVKNVRITAGTTQTIATAAGVAWSGQSGTVHVIDTTSAGSAATVSVASGTVSCDYMSLKDSAAFGGAAFYAGANSTNVSGNSGWLFSAPVTFVPFVIMS